MPLRASCFVIASLLSTQVAHAKLASEFQAPEIRLTADIVKLPIVMVRHFPFIEGSVNGVSGKFMLDTGAQRAMSLNDHRIPLTGGAPAGEGHFGSGQTFNLMMRPQVSDVNIGSLHFDRVTRFQSQSATMLEDHVTHDFLGWFGYQAWSAYAMKLDYQPAQVTFYRIGPEAFLAGEAIVAKLPYQTRKLPNIPIVAGKLGSVDLPVNFDTGQYGGINVDQDTRDRLIKEGHLVPRGDGTYDVKGLRLGNNVTVDIPKVSVSTEPFAAGAAEAIDITERNTMSVGYGLLSQYVTVWDFPHQVIYFLKAHGQPGDDAPSTAAETR